MTNTLTPIQTINAYNYALKHLTFAKTALEQSKVTNTPAMKLNERRLNDIQNEIPLYQSVLDQYENESDTAENTLTDNQQKSAYWYALRHLFSVKEELEKQNDASERIADIENEMNLYTDQLGIEKIKHKTDLYEGPLNKTLNKKTS